MKHRGGGCGPQLGVGECENEKPELPSGIGGGREHPSFGQFRKINNLSWRGIG